MAIPKLGVPKAVPKSPVQIPSPKMLAEYEAISKERADEIMEMVRTELKANDRYALRGQSFAFITFSGLTACAGWMAYRGNNHAVYAFLTATTISVVTTFITARR
jgi:hypothetical protein